MLVYYDVKTYTAVKATEDNPRNSEASIIELKDGSLLMAWQCYQKSEFGSNDCAPSNISLMNSYDNGATWENRRVVAEMNGECVNLYSPSFIRSDDGKLLLFFKRYTQLAEGEQTRANYYKIISEDEGETWSKEQLIFEDVTAFPINHTIKRLSDGAWLIPLEDIEGKWITENEHSSIVVLRTEDELKTLTKSNKITVPMRGAMEPCIAQCADGTINMVMRTQLGSVFYSKSCDGGKTWSKPQTTGLRSPESCPCIVSVPGSDAQIVIWNNSEYDMTWYSHYGKRTPLTMAITRDSFKTFTDFYDIETDPNRVFTNPSVTVTSDGLFVLSYHTTPYSSIGRMEGLCDLKVTTFRLKE